MRAFVCVLDPSPQKALGCEEGPVCMCACVCVSVDVFACGCVSEFKPGRGTRPLTQCRG